MKVEVYKELNARQQAVLAAIVEVYIETGEAVGSTLVSRRSIVRMSPATVRNLARDLRDMGYLLKEHSSAGSQPSVEGIRYYVERLLPKRRVANQVKSEISALFGNDFSDTFTLFREMGELLSFLARQLGVVVVTRPINLKLHKIEAIPLSTNTFSILLIFDNGGTRSFIYRSGMEQKRLVALIDVLNERLSGLPLAEITTSIEDRLRDLRGLHDSFIERLIRDRCDIFGTDKSEDRVIVGNPEEGDVLDLTNIGRPLIKSAVERKNENVRLDTDGQIVLVSCEFTSLEGPGIVGFLGPKRLPYTRIVPIVRFAAGAITDHLKGE